MKLHFIVALAVVFLACSAHAQEAETSKVSFWIL
jgi:hypothetical protein